MFSFFVLFAAALFILLGAWHSADDPINISKADTIITVNLLERQTPLPACLPFLTCSSPDAAFHVPPWRSACGPVPVALSSNRRITKRKITISTPLILDKKRERMNSYKPEDKRWKSTSHPSENNLLLLIHYKGIIVGLSAPLWHQKDKYHWGLSDACPEHTWTWCCISATTALKAEVVPFLKQHFCAILPYSHILLPRLIKRLIKEGGRHEVLVTATFPHIYEKSSPDSFISKSK